jgi:Transcriptional regulator, AbiEi antitoxin/Protein of unknown function (DUF559)
MRSGPRPRRELCLLAVAEAQNGLVTVEQLHALGFTESAISRLVARGRLHRIHRGVYAVGRRELSREGVFQAAVLAIGDDSVAGYFAARSGNEDDLVVVLRAGGFPPFETNAHPPGTPDWVEVDVLFKQQKLVIEVDGGRWHTTKFRRETDAQKQAIVEAAGYRVIRLSEDDQANTAQTEARIWHGLGSPPTIAENGLGSA